VLTPSHAAVSFYCEVYQDSARTVTWLVRVQDATGRQLVATAPAQTAIGSGGGPLTGSLDLAGLPPGNYQLALVVGSGADTVSRAAPFRMGGIETEQHLEQVTRAAAEPTDLFARASEAQLDTLYEPLVYLSSGSDMSLYRGLTVDGKRRFLRDFWRQRDPTPATPDNAEMAAFYKRIGEANVRFREGGAAQVPGWRTDRGRVLIKYGEPDQVMKRPQSGPDRPWEAWKYSRGRGLKFVFMDMTRLGNYSLIYTNDRTERGMPNWATMLSDDAIQEIVRL
jgi:GWxTD domain-containing protein